MQVLANQTKTMNDSSDQPSHDSSQWLRLFGDPEAKN